MIDLKGNTNFVAFKNLQEEYIVPRTNLAAVDMDVANGLDVVGNTMSINLATTNDIMNGTTGSVVDPSILRSIFTIGQAVDVTSEPDNATSYSKTVAFTTTGNYLGFASFPKYAPDLVYLMIATVSVNSATTINTAGSWLDGTTGAKNIAANTPMKVVMLFSSQSTAKFTFGKSVTATVTDMREYEVTKCTEQARQYIAALYNLDNWSDYYFIKQDMVEPFTYIIPMGNSPEVTVAAGLAYSLNATTGTHTLAVDTCPEGYVGRDTYIRIALGGNSVINAREPLQIADPLTPYAINNCVVQYRNGEAFLHVNDTLAGYVVTQISGDTAGTLPYALTTAMESPYIAFGAQTDGLVVDMGTVSTANTEKLVAGNGYNNTTITGSINCTNKTVVAGASLQDVVVTGGTLTLGDVLIPSGSTVAVSGGGLVAEKVSGNGGVIDLGAGPYLPCSNAVVAISGCTITHSGNRALLVNKKGNATLGNISFVSNGAANLYGGGAVMIQFGGSCSIRDCRFDSNLASFGAAVRLVGSSTYSTTADLVNCTFMNNGARAINIDYAGATASLSGCVFGDGQNIVMRHHEEGQPSLKLIGSNTIYSIYPYDNSSGGNITVSSGAVIDLTNNNNETPINPGGSIAFASGGATVLYDHDSNGSAMASSESYMIDNVTLPAGAVLTNTNVVNLNKKQAIISAGSSTAASNVIISGGSAAAYGGAFSVYGNATFTSCTFVDNTTSRGGALSVAATGVVTLIGCSARANNATHVANFGYCSGNIIMSECTLTGNQNILVRGGTVTFIGSNNIGTTVGYHNVTGNAIISAGATLNLTDNPYATIVAPGNGLTLYGTNDYSNQTTIIGSAGAATQSRGFSAQCTVTGRAIAKIGAITGATVSIPSGSCKIDFIKSGETTVSSTSIQASASPYVLDTEQGADALLVGVSED